MNHVSRQAVFRFAEQIDLPRIVEIYNGTVSGRMVTADLEPVSVDSRQTWFECHSRNHHPLWVIEQGNRVVGWASLSAFYGRPAYVATAEISIYLDETVRGQGLGKAALDYVLADCERLGIRTLLGFIFSHNLPSLNLFRKAGFSQWGELPDVAEMDGIKRSLTIMGLPV